MGVAVAAAVMPLTPHTPLAASAVPAGPELRTVDEEDAEGAEDQTSAPDLRVVLDEVEPVVIRPGQPLRLRGRVVNDGDSLQRPEAVTLRLAGTEPRSRQQVADWVAGRTPLEGATTLGDDTVGPILPPGQEMPFAITVPTDTLRDLGDEPRALATELSVAVRPPGRPASSPALSQVDPADVPTLRTVLTSSGRDPVEAPLETSWLVPLTLPGDPALVSSDPRTHTRAWWEAVGPSSTIRGWLDGLGVEDVTWVVDPAVLDPVRPSRSLATPRVEDEDPGDEDGAADAPDDDATSTAAPTSPGTEDPASATGSPSPAPAPTKDPDDSNDPDDTTATAEPPDLEDPEDPTTGAPEPTAPPSPAQVDATWVNAALSAVRADLAAAGPDGLWWLPAGDPDLSVLLARDLTVQEAGAVLRTDPTVEVEDPELASRGRTVAWPTSPAPTDNDLSRLTHLLLQADGTDDPLVVVPREAYTGDTAALPRRGAAVVTDIDDLTTIGPDSWTSALVAGSAARAEEQGAGAAAQQLLAHTVATYLEDPASGRELVIAPPRGTVPDPEVLAQVTEGWSRAGWLESVPAPELVDRAAEQDAVTPTGTGPDTDLLAEAGADLAAPASPLNQERVEQLVRFSSDLEGLASMFRDTSGVRSWQRVLGDLWSTRWRQDPKGWEQVRDTLRSDIATTRDGVRVIPSTVNFLADTGTIHVTVVNELPVAVEDVGVRFSPSNARLQIVRQPDPVSVGPDSRATVAVDVRAVTRGDTTLTARMTTPDGDTLGSEENVAVHVQPTGTWIYWVLGLLGGGLLVLGLARAWRRGRRTRPTYPGAAPPGASQTGKENRP